MCIALTDVTYIKFGAINSIIPIHTLKREHEKLTPERNKKRSIVEIEDGP